jgi:hypothetical protein
LPSQRTGGYARDEVCVSGELRLLRRKAALFKAAVEAAVAGGSERAERPVEVRPAIRAVIDEPDPLRKLERYADTQPGIQGTPRAAIPDAGRGDGGRAELASVWEELEEAASLEGMARLRSIKTKRARSAKE